MTPAIERLTAALEQAKRIHGKRITEIKAALQKEWDKVFDADKTLQRAITDLESSQNWVSGEDGIYRYVSFYDLDSYDDCREFLDAYLADHAVYIEGESLSTYEGPSLIINDEGDVYDQDSGKWVVRRGDYQNDPRDDSDQEEARRNALIEAYMEKTGYYPGVFRADRHGNVFLVNTQSKAGV